MKFTFISLLCFAFINQWASATPTLKFSDKLVKSLNEFIKDAPNTKKHLFKTPNKYLKQIENLNQELNPRVISFEGIKGLPPLNVFGTMNVALKNVDTLQVRSGDEFVTIQVNYSEKDLTNPFIDLTLSRLQNVIVKDNIYNISSADKILLEISEKVTAGVKNLKMDNSGRDGMSKLTELFIDGTKVSPYHIKSLIRISDDLELLEYSYTSKIPLSKLEVGDIETLLDVFSKVISKSSDDAAGNMILELPGM